MITYHHDIEQGTPEWHKLREGVLTSTAIKTLITPTGKLADNDKHGRTFMRLPRNG